MRRSPLTTDHSGRADACNPTRTKNDHGLHGCDGFGEELLNLPIRVIRVTIDSTLVGARRVPSCDRKVSSPRPHYLRERVRVREPGRRGSARTPEPGGGRVERIIGKKVDPSPPPSPAVMRERGCFQTPAPTWVPGVSPRWVFRDIRGSGSAACDWGRC